MYCAGSRPLRDCACTARPTGGRWAVSSWNGPRCRLPVGGHPQPRSAAGAAADAPRSPATREAARPAGEPRGLPPECHGGGSGNPGGGRTAAGPLSRGPPTHGRAAAPPGGPLWSATARGGLHACPVLRRRHVHDHETHPGHALEHEAMPESAPTAPTSLFVRPAAERVGNLLGGGPWS